MDGKDKDFESNETSTDEDLECDDFLADEDGDHDEGPFLSLKSLSDELEASLTGNEALSRITRNSVFATEHDVLEYISPFPVSSAFTDSIVGRHHQDVRFSDPPWPKMQRIRHWQWTTSSCSGEVSE